MAFPFFWRIQSIWPFSGHKFDDLKASHDLVRKLSIPEHTKEFVFAIRDPETKSVVYILSAQNLSKGSALDAECLIREIKPDAVVTQAEIQSEENRIEDGVDFPVPTSSFGVLKRCFMDKITKEKYENVAGNCVLREIFGIGFYGHFLAAKKAAEEVGSSFLMLESPFVRCSGSNDNNSNRSGEIKVGSKFQGLVSNLVPQKVGPAVSLSSSRRFCLIDDVRSQIVKMLSTSVVGPSNPLSKVGPEKVQPKDDFEPPSYAQTFYPLLVDLHEIFIDIPSIGSALAHAQKMLSGVNRGEVVDTQIISEVYTFRIAVEALRIALNNSGRLPLEKTKKPTSANVDFNELPAEDKSHVLFAHAIKSQTTKFKTIVAVVDANALAGLRKHWNTPLPLEVKDLVEELIINYGEGDGVLSDYNDKKRLIRDKPMVAVGAGATAVLGVSSFSKAIPASTVMKIVTFKVPASLKLFLTQTQKVASLVFGKTLGPTKLVAPGITGTGAKTTSILKASASTEKIRAVAHSVIASAEKTSFSAMRTAFYEIMRKRRVKPIGFLPWATFGCSVATCSGLLVCGDGIECAVESLPSAPSIASLGRGIQSLHQASLAVRETDGYRIQKSIESIMHRFKYRTIQ